jgi:hypothetical protein
MSIEIKHDDPQESAAKLDRPEITARALMVYDPHLPAQLMDAWRSISGDKDSEAGEDL